MNRLNRTALTVGLMSSLVLGFASAQDILIRGAKVYTVGAQGTLAKADVLLRDGKIAAIGASLQAPAGATVVEAKGRALTPGIWAGLSPLGLEEIATVESSVNSKITIGAPSWQPQWRPEFDVTAAFNPRSFRLQLERVEGVTWAMLKPKSDTLIEGQGTAVTLDGRYEASVAGSRTLFINFEDSGVKASGGSRAAEYMLLDQAIRETRTTGTPATNALLHEAGREALAHYLNGGRVVFHVERAVDILKVVAYARGHGMKPIISGGAEAWVVADELAREHVPVLLDPSVSLPQTFDSLGARLENAALLYKAGVQIAFSWPPYPDAHTPILRQLAGNAVAHGLKWDAALAAITANPAKIFGLGASRGRIEIGQVADVVLWSGDPLEVTSLADQVWITGRPIEMRSRATELRDRYLRSNKSEQ